MRILYPYNEILPKKSAHDVYIARNCSSLAAAGCDVELLCGSGSLPPDQLAEHYNLEQNSRFSWQTLPIIRKNLGLPLTWDTLFFWGTQRYITRQRPDWVALSVFKQGAYHLQRRLPGVRYVYEVHELAWYPGRDANEPKLRKRLDIERAMFTRADAVTVTTGALRDILRAPPYALTVPVAVVPLAVSFAPLPPPPPPEGEIRVMYVGQMYEGQGVELLLQALARTERIRLTLIGGKPDELAALQQLVRSLEIDGRVEFAGFRPPAEIPALVRGAHALAAPFSAAGRMPFVAHTKLLEYAAWQRPVVAPDLPVTREHFDEARGWLPFVADDIDSLAGALKSLNRDAAWQRLYEASRTQHVLDWSERSRRYLDFLQSV
jgi:glycosyltransferase involved in cell wall biosynthesis